MTVSFAECFMFLKQNRMIDIGRDDITTISERVMHPAQNPLHGVFHSEAIDLHTEEVNPWPCRKMKLAGNPMRRRQSNIRPLH